MPEMSFRETSLSFTWMTFMSHKGDAQPLRSQAMNELRTWHYSIYSIGFHCVSWIGHHHESVHVFILFQNSSWNKGCAECFLSKGSSRKEFMEKDLFGSVLIIRQFCSWAGDGVFSPYLITLLVGFVQHHWLMISGQKYKSISLQNAWLTRNKYHQQLRVNDNIKAILEIEASVSETAQLWILVALGQTRQDGSCLRASGQIWWSTAGAGCWTRWTLSVSQQGCSYFLNFLSSSAKLL